MEKDLHQRIATANACKWECILQCQLEESEVEVEALSISGCSKASRAKSGSGTSQHSCDSSKMRGHSRDRSGACHHSRHMGHKARSASWTIPDLDHHTDQPFRDCVESTN